MNFNTNSVQDVISFWWPEVTRFVKIECCINNSIVSLESVSDSICHVAIKNSFDQKENRSRICDNFRCASDLFVKSVEAAISGFNLGARQEEFENEFDQLRVEDVPAKNSYDSLLAIAKSYENDAKALLELANNIRQKAEQIK